MVDSSIEVDAECSVTSASASWRISTISSLPGFFFLGIVTYIADLRVECDSSAGSHSSESESGEETGLIDGLNVDTAIDVHQIQFTCGWSRFICYT